MAGKATPIPSPGRDWASRAHRAAPLLNSENAWAATLGPGRIKGPARIAARHPRDPSLHLGYAITRSGRERIAVLSVAEYHRLKRRDRKVMGLDDFTEPRPTLKRSAT